MGLIELFADIFIRNFEFLDSSGGHIEHGVDHHTLHDGAQYTSSKLILHGLVDEGLHRLLRERQLHTIHLEELLVLTDDGVLRLRQDLLQGLTVERIQIGEHWQTANDLGDKSE